VIVHSQPGSQSGDPRTHGAVPSTNGRSEKPVSDTALRSAAEQALRPLKSLSLSHAASTAARSHYDEPAYTAAAMQVALCRAAMDGYRPGTFEQWRGKCL